MLDTLFWYTGLVAWIFIVFGWAAMLYCTAPDKGVLKRATGRVPPDDSLDLCRYEQASWRPRLPQGLRQPGSRASVD
jgi:hypothetical protein